MNRSILSASLLAFLGLAVTGCKPSANPASNGSGKPVVFVSVLPQMGIAKRLAGDTVDVQALVGAGQDPHNYATTPQQSIALGKAVALFTAGMPFEEPLLERLEGGSATLKIVDTLQGMKIREGEEHGHEGEDHDHDHEHCHERDTHVWLSPVALKHQAENIARALQKIVPSEKENIAANMAALAAELDTLHLELAERMKPFSGRTVFVYHPAFGYFTDAYGMWQESVEIDGKTPTQKELTRFIALAKEQGVRVLFVQPQFDRKAADAIAREVGAQVESLDPLGEDAIASIRLIADTLENAFKPKS